MERNEERMKETGRRIKECMEERGYNQKTLAAATFISYPHFNNIINGHRELSDINADRICDVLNRNAPIKRYTQKMRVIDLPEDKANQYLAKGFKYDDIVDGCLESTLIINPLYLTCEVDENDKYISQTDKENELRDAIQKLVRASFLYKIEGSFIADPYLEEYIRSDEMPSEYEDRTRILRITRLEDNYTVAFTRSEAGLMLSDYISAIQYVTESAFRRREYEYRKNEYLDKKMRQKRQERKGPRIIEVTDLEPDEQE